MAGSVAILVFAEGILLVCSRQNSPTTEFQDHKSIYTYDRCTVEMVENKAGW